MPLAITAAIIDWLTIPLAFLVVLTVVVFIHELGHFLVARWCGVAVKEFSIGFGREIAGFNDKKGTRWKIGWLPLGGYVKFIDDMAATSQPSPEVIAKMSPEERAGSFQLKPVWKRAAVVVAGPVANFLLAIAIYAAFAYFYGILSTEPRVSGLVEGGPAKAAGVLPGDKIVKIDGEDISSFDDMVRFVQLSSGREFTLTVERNGGMQDIKLRPKPMTRKDPVTGVEAEQWMIGIEHKPEADQIKVREAGVGEALWFGVDRTVFIISATGNYIGDVLTGKRSADQIGSAVRIADVSGKFAKIGPDALVQLIAVLSVSIGLLNLFPIPPLDGGHLMFYAAEAVRREPLSPNVQEISFRIGISVVLSLMLFGLYNDRSVLSRWWSNITSLFS
jgi:regulator of sigma E protease